MNNDTGKSFGIGKVADRITGKISNGTTTTNL